MRAYCGVDVAKATLAVCLTREDGKIARQEYENTAKGHRRLLKWARAQAPGAGVHFCMEATGRYGEALALHLSEAGERVSVVNPARVKQFARSQGRRNKTDRVDAQVIAEYCRALEPAPWVPPSPELRELRAMMRRLEDLEQQRQREKVRLQEPGEVASVRRSLQRSLRFLDRQIGELEQQVRDHIDRHGELREDKRLLESIPGIAEKTALWFLAVARPPSAFRSGEALAAYLGLAPCQRRSGTSVRGRSRISKGGGRQLRKVLYWAAQSAMRHNPLLRQFCQRLAAKGKSRMSILVAAMRKLAMIAFGVLRSGRPFSYA